MKKATLRQTDPTTDRRYIIVLEHTPSHTIEAYESVAGDIEEAIDFTKLDLAAALLTSGATYRDDEWRLVRTFQLR